MSELSGDWVITNGCPPFPASPAGYTDVHSCITSGSWRGAGAGSDRLVSQCLWRLGHAFTDPGCLLGHGPSCTLLSPGMEAREQQEYDMNRLVFGHRKCRMVCGHVGGWACGCMGVCVCGCVGGWVYECVGRAWGVYNCVAGWWGGWDVSDMEILFSRVDKIDQFSTVSVVCARARLVEY